VIARLFPRTNPQDPTPVVQLLALMLLFGVLGVLLMPWIWALLSSFKARSEIMSTGFWPEQWQIANYVDLFTTTLYGRWLLNSAIVSVSAAMVGMLVCGMAGYAFAKFRFAGQTILFWIVIASVSIPPFTTVIPLFGWIAQLGLLNTYPVLILPFAASAFGLFMLRQYISTLPDELIEAARIDGCGEIRLFFTIIVPLCRPALGTVGILIFISSWNSFIWPLVFMRSDEMFTLPVGIAGLNSEQMAEYGLIMAAAIVSCIPMLAVFFVMQKQIIAGLTRGAVKT
jgi:multiple sugar transport system permease protein